MATRSSFLIYISFTIILASPSIVRPYMPPPAQVIELMSDKFARIETLKIIQHTTVRDLMEEEEVVFGEVVYVRAPYQYRSEMAGQPGKRLIVHNGTRTLQIINGAVRFDGESQDLLYRFLLLGQRPKRLLEGLRLIGINVDAMSLTRFEGRIAYLIGEKEEGSPRLLVDKDEFVPLLLRYGDVSFRFTDYRDIAERVWYPYEIVYTRTGTTMEEYGVREITVNPPLDLTLFDIPLTREQYATGELDRERSEPEISDNLE
jgi:hypothetical protein